MLTDEMKRLIQDYSAGSVATVNPDGTPSVSPKATFVIVNDDTIAFGNLRSPRTAANLRANSAIEICFTDVLARKALRVTGKGVSFKKPDAAPQVHDAFNALWADYIPNMSAFVVIEISSVQMILSPAYDLGLTEASLIETNLARLNAL